MTDRYVKRFSATRIQRFEGWVRWLLPIIAEGLVAVGYFAALLIIPVILISMI